MNSWRFLLLLPCLVALAMSAELRAQAERDDQDAAQWDAPSAVDTTPYVETAREALGERNRLPWYDAEQDDVRAIDAPPSDSGQFSNRQSRWNSTPAKPVQRTGSNWQFGTLGDIFWTVIKVVFWLVVAVVLGFLVYLLIRAYLQRENAALAVNTRATFSEMNAEDDERIESLPFTVARPRGDLLDEAHAQYQAGNFRQAVIYLYSYLLIQLDRHQQIHLARGKTNRAYLRELRQHPQLRAILEQTMLAFEDVFFGNHPLSRETFEACWHQLDDFHKHVEQVAA